MEKKPAIDAIRYVKTEEDEKWEIIDLDHKVHVLPITSKRQMTAFLDTVGRIRCDTQCGRIRVVDVTVTVYY